MGIEGRQHIPKSGAFVLAPIHRSNMDTPIASCLTRRRMRFMGKDTLWKGRALSWFWSSLGGFPVSAGHCRSRGPAAVHRRAPGG